MASAGTGNATHVAGELFKVMTHIDMTHVPYRGAGPAVTNLLGGQVQALRLRRAQARQKLALARAKRSRKCSSATVTLDCST